MIRSFKRYVESYWLVLLICAISACQQEADKLADDGVNKFSDPVLTRIYDYQDRRDVQALVGFFNDKVPKYREQAALACASVQDTAAIRPLSLLLYDDNARVRRAAAYALGQAHDRQCIDPLAQALQEEDSAIVRKELIEALGKVITMEKIGLLHRVTIGSEKEKEGLAWGLYRAGIRNVHDGISVDIALDLLNVSNSYETRLGAAHFFARSPNLALAGRENVLVQTATTDPAPNVRMAAALALGKAVTQKSSKVLVTAISKDTDPRVRVNCVRALKNFIGEDVQQCLMKFLGDENINVRVAAGEVLVSRPMNMNLNQVMNIDDWRVKSILLGGLLAHTQDKNELVHTVQAEYQATSNPYYKASLARALGNAIEAREFIFDQAMNTRHYAVRTAAVQALIGIRQGEKFPPIMEKDFAKWFQQIIETGDVGSVALVSQMYLRPALKFQDQYDDYEFLKTAKNKLKLPRDNEALQVLNAAIALFNGNKDVPVTKNPFNHPIDWERVKSIPKKKKVIIKTTKGNITLRLLVEDAPGTVSSFLALVDTGYFNGKTFHRVVPNFVVQGGCHRGDGYGSEDYSLRSEFPNLRYQHGSVGVASAGKDTEGTQWFITHSPTPHLDGRYTIFAQVEDGMDVVQEIEIGDEIVEVSEVNSL